MNSEGSKAILTEERPGSCRQGLRKRLTYRLLLGRNKPGLFLKLSTEGVDVALRLGSCLLLILRQGGMEPLILLLHLVGTGRLVSQMSVGTQVPQVRRVVPIAKCWWQVSPEARLNF